MEMELKKCLVRDSPSGSNKDLPDNIVLNNNVTYTSDQGTWNKNSLVLTAAESRSFSITSIKVN